MEPKVLVKMKFGSHLYGLNTSSSDTDYFTVIIPPLEDLYYEDKKKLMYSTSTGDDKTKNTSQDVDSDVYTLSQFLDLLFAGDVRAIDAVHSHAGVEETSTPFWDMLKSLRTMFYTRDITSYMGYCKRQAYKYAIKGSRLNSYQNLVQYFESLGEIDKKLRVEDIKEDLLRISQGDVHTQRITGFFKKGEWHEKAGWRIAGSIYYDKSLVKDMVRSITARYSDYGDRAKSTLENGGVDFKALSHALRAGYQCEAIYKDGDFTYPLPQTDFLLQVKKGEVPLEEVIEELESLVDRVTGMSAVSTLPDNAEDIKEFWYKAMEIEYHTYYNTQIEKELQCHNS